MTKDTDTERAAAFRKFLNEAPAGIIGHDTAFNAGAAWGQARAAIAQQPDLDKLAALIEDAFREGFSAPETYNDKLVNDADEAWGKAKASLLKGAAIAQPAEPAGSWVVEWGAVSLPHGDPSRVTSKSYHDTEHEALLALEEAQQEFNARMYQVAPVDDLRSLKASLAAIHYRAAGAPALDAAAARAIADECEAVLPELKGLSQFDARLGPAQADAQPVAPALYVSPGQMESLTDPEGEFGRYLPCRKTPKGNFTQPLYAAPPPARQPAADAQPVAWVWKHTGSGGEGLYWQHPSTYGIDMENPLYEWTLLYAAAPPARQPQWMPIETAPKDGKKLTLFYLNRNGLARTVMARWLTDEQAAETDSDGVGLEGGWYECIDNWDDYTEVAIHEGEPSHWMPLPPPPGGIGEGE